MEEVAEGIFKIAAKMMLAVVRFLIWFTWEVMCETILWYIGWPVTRAITFGAYPKQSIANGENEDPLIFFLVAIIGFASLLFMAFILLKYIAQ